MSHGCVRRVGGKAKGSDLPVGGEAPLHDRVEHLHPVVFTVRTLQTVANAGTIRAHVVLKGGRLGVPSGPDGAVVVAQLGDLVQAPLALVQRLVVGFVVVGHPHQSPIGIVAPAMEGTGKDQGIAVVIAADLHALVAAGVEEGVEALVAPVPHQNDLLFPHTGDYEIAGIGDLALVTQEEPAAGEDLLQLHLVDLLALALLLADSATPPMLACPHQACPSLSRMRLLQPTPATAWVSTLAPLG